MQGEIVLLCLIAIINGFEWISAQQALMDMSGAIGALNVLIKEVDMKLPLPSDAEIKANTKYKPNPPELPVRNSTKVVSEIRIKLVTNSYH